MASTTESSGFTSWPRRWMVAGIWTALALSYVVSSAVTSISEGNSPSWRRALVWSLASGYVWMLLTPIVAGVARRAGPGRVRFWGFHLPASFVMSAAQVFIVLMIYWWLCGPPASRMDMTTNEYLRTQFVYNGHISWLTYWVLVVVLRAIDSQKYLRDERIRNASLETQLVQSQLQTLRMQLQPHFLFNTLNAISALTLADPMKARLMISRLSDFLRLTLEERYAPKVPLSRELELLACYIDILQVRFQDHLTTHVNASAESLRGCVPNMILQPLVENALQHGLLEKPEAGVLIVAAFREGEILVLSVEDDGLCLPSDSLQDGLGLSNTRSRLSALFGAAGTLQLMRKPTGGTRVELRFPYQESIV